jgi:AraC-like DNA-binding protein
VFFLILLLGKKNKTLPDLLLGIIFFLYAVSIGGVYLEIYNIKNNYPFPAIINLSWIFLFLHGPALWFYIKCLSDDNFVFKPIFLLHFIPFIIFSIFHYITFIDLPDYKKIILLENDQFKEQVFYKLSVLSIGISTITYNIWALNLISKRRVMLMLQYSKVEDIDLRWLNTLTIAALISYSLNVALFNLDLIFHFANYKFLLRLSYSFASLYIMFLGYFGLQQDNIFINRIGKNEGSELKPANNKNTSSEKTTDKVFINILINYVEKNQPYLEPEITISRLSEMLNVRIEFLSDVLNSQLNQNFFDFINKYRVEEFKNQCILKTNSHLTILGIAYGCGFNSKASFYRAFRKFEGISPSAYIKKVS